MNFQRETFTRALRRGALHTFVELALCYPESMSINNIADKADIGRNQVSRAIKYLESVGKVVRTGRYSVRLTPGALSEFLSLFPVDNSVDNSEAFFAKVAGMHRKSASDAPQKCFPHDHDHDDDKDHHMDNEDSLAAVKNSEVIERLESLDPPFVGAAAFTRKYSSGLIAAWLDHYDTLPSRAREQLNAPAFVNGKVRQGEAPPTTKKKTAVCCECGREVSENFKSLCEAKGIDNYCINCFYDESIGKEWIR